MRHPLEIKIDYGDALRILGKLADKLHKRGQLKETISMALNEAIDTAQTEANKAIREEYAAPQHEVRRSMRIWYASREKLEAQLVGRGRMSVELIHYKAGATARGVSVKVLKSAKKSVIPAGGDMDILETQKRKRPRTWIAKNHVLAMTGKEKQPIRMLWGPGFITRLSNEDIRARVLQKGTDKLRKRVKGIAKHVLGRS